MYRALLDMEVRKVYTTGMNFSIGGKQTVAKVKINFVKLLAAKSEEMNTLLTPTEVASITNIDRRKLYTLRDMSISGQKLDDEKLPLKIGEFAQLCDFLGCHLGELVEYVPTSPLAAGQQMPAMRQPEVAVAA